MQRAWKKALAFLMVGAIAAASMSGCSSSPSKTSSAAANGKKVLTVAWWGNQVRNQRTTDALKEYSKENPGVTFETQVYQFSSYWDKLATAAAGGSLPDVIQMDYGYLDQYNASNLLVDLGSYISSGKLDVSSVDKNILNTGTINGKVVAIPAGINSPSLCYNKSLLDKIGVKVKDYMTIDDFAAISDEVFKKTGYKTNYAYQQGQPVFEYMLRAQHKVLFEDGKLGVDNASQLEPYYDLREEGRKAGWLIDPNVFTTTVNTTADQDPFVYGTKPETRSWCVFCNSNELINYQNIVNGKFEIGVTTYPSADPKASGYLKPCMFFCVTSNSKDPDEGAKFVNYITNSEACNNILLGERGMPVSSKIAAEITPKISDSDKRAFAYLNDVVTPNCSAVNPPAPSGSTEVAQLLKDLDEQIDYGKITAKDAAQQLFDKGNTTMASKKS